MPPSGVVEPSSVDVPGPVVLDPQVDAPLMAVPGAGAAMDSGWGESDATLIPANPWPATLDDWTWQLLPAGILYKSYLASGREARIGAQFFHERDRSGLLDATLGGRVGLLRYGTQDALRPEGWQLDGEVAAFPRLTLDDQWDLISTDFRLGLPLTFRRGYVEAKFGYNHLSSHLGDEYIRRIRPGAQGNEYVRDALALGLALRPTEAMRVYGEAGWAFRTKGPSQPWEFQFGLDVSPPLPNGCRGGPFFGVHGRLREELDYSGSLTVETGWQWRGQSGQLLRTGFHYFNGKSDQVQFLNEHEEQIGAGLWYDY
ncbi:MAG: DUF1207 domain-containing protein [Thermoguttaceae bacterium]|nr:DUF1207 domain-containing protein [Thermoguttaceae bacterium]